MTGYHVETVKSGNSTPRECMANQRSERMGCVEVELPSFSQLSRQWQQCKSALLYIGRKGLIPTCSHRLQWLRP